MAERSVEDFLEHHGVKGMKWGQRKDRAPGVTKQVDKHARRDAQEFARAKSFYGEGAGTRRKLIKQTVDHKSANVPGYKKAFDHHLSRQDMSKHADKAVSERTRTDRNTKNKQRVTAVARRITGEHGTQAALVALVAAGAAFLRSPKGRQIMNKPMIKLDMAKQNISVERMRSKRAKDIAKVIKMSP
jgi:hypothetical protein